MNTTPHTQEKAHQPEGQRANSGGRSAPVIRWEEKEEAHSGHALGFGQLGPDGSPVIRAQVATGDGASGGALDGRAVIRRWNRAACPPIAYDRLANTNR